MSKLFAVLEDEKVIVGDSSIEEDMFQQALENNKLSEDLQRQKDAVETGEVLEKIEAAESPEAAIEVAKEHLLSKIGYKKSFVLEDFKQDLKSGLSIAQEGMLSRIGNAIKRSFTTTNKMADKLDQALNDLKEKGSKTDLLIDPGWSKYLIATSNKIITSAEVMSFLKHIEGTMDIAKIDKHLSDIADVLNLIAKELNNSTFISDKKTETSIISIYGATEKTFREFEKTVNLQEKPNNIDRYPSYAPIEYKDAIKLRDYLITEYSYKAYQGGGFAASKSAMERLEEIMNYRKITSIRFHYLMQSPSDVKMAEDITNRVWESLGKLTEIIEYRNRVAYAAMRYIESSVQKVYY